eukprot:TRINITY_DN0_c3911_g1_i1.p1 TRINITY_DN0_c3911_g1~~TRINITY_DN0_c3911_g1_i1.p1  ORF type:complete len:110 (-),score=35.52 TRINITY_DN0_c3911_g1_i1:37-366(-)
MASLGATAQNLVSELVQNIEEMREQRERLRNEIIAEDEEKVRVEREIELLTDRLEKINEFLARGAAEKKELEKTIVDTENARAKIAESLKTLLNVLQKENYYHAKGGKK